MRVRIFANKRIWASWRVHTSNVDGDVGVRVGTVEFKYGDFADGHLMKSATVHADSCRISNINAPRTSYTSISLNQSINLVA